MTFNQPFRLRHLVKVILPIAGRVATLWTVAYLLKLTSSERRAEKFSQKNANFKIQVAMTERYEAAVPFFGVSCRSFRCEIDVLVKVTNTRLYFYNSCEAMLNVAASMALTVRFWCSVKSVEEKSRQTT